LEHRDLPTFDVTAPKWQFDGTFHHQIALFCTVSAKEMLARGLA
jgi:hypothetical protein